MSLNKKKELSLCDVNVPFKSIYMWETLYYLHEQTGWFTVCANGKQNSAMVKFVPESHLPFVQINSQKGHENLESPGVKDGSEQIEHKFPVGTFLQKKQDCLFRCSLAPGNFPLKRPEKSSSFNRIFRKPFVKLMVNNPWALIDKL